MSFRGLNKVQLIGHLGHDPESFLTSHGKKIARVSIATSERWKDPATGEQRTQTEWHVVVFFGKLAEIAHQYLKKGSKVYIEGKQKTRQYTDKTGINRSITEVIGHELNLLDNKDPSIHSELRPQFEDIPVDTVDEHACQEEPAF